MSRLIANHMLPGRLTPGEKTTISGGHYCSGVHFGGTPCVSLCVSV